jgi:GR25 family glycosyltransferase involved in LPS biosynthesis
MKLFDRFNKVYCINLDRRPDRLESFNTQVEKYDLGDYTRVSAVDGNNINPKDYGSNLRSGELALVLTNLQIFEDAKKNSYNSILILEDDCIFTEEILNIEEYFKVLPEDWDMLYMGGNHNTHGGLAPPVKINDKVQKLHSTFSTHFIGINHNMINLINKFVNYTEQIDVCYTRIQKNYNVYSFYPAIAKQIVGFSDIQNSITDYDWLIN